MLRTFEADSRVKIAVSALGGLLALVVGAKSLASYQRKRTAKVCKEENVVVAVIGAGFSGIVAAHHLAKAGIDYVVYEKAADVGGTWLHNRYPGAACDIESYLYQPSFYQRGAWSSNYPGRDELHNYTQQAVRELGITPHLRLQHELVAARWDESAKEWVMRMRVPVRGESSAPADGDNNTFEEVVVRHRFVMAAAGPLHYPSFPSSIPNYGAFAGPSFHSAEWPEEGMGAVAGKRVGIVGSAASAVQIAASIAPHVRHLTVFQRTPSWVAPRFEAPFGALANHLFSIPWIAKMYRAALFVRHEVLLSAFRHPRSFLHRLFAREVRTFMERQLKTPDLIRTMIPSYRIGCKRVVVNSEYLRTFRRSNVTLVTEKIARFDKGGVVTYVGEGYADADKGPVGDGGGGGEGGGTPLVRGSAVVGDVITGGVSVGALEGSTTTANVSTEVTGISKGRERLHQLDVIVYATGFELMARDANIVKSVKGSDGQPLLAVWGDRPTAYLGAMTATAPNWFIMLGPNTGLGHNSVVLMVESQVHFIMRVLRTFFAPLTPKEWALRGQGVQAVAVRPEVEEAWSSWCDKELQNTVWKTGGCHSWYQNARGVLFSLWPHSTQRFWWQTWTASIDNLRFW